MKAKLRVIPLNKTNLDLLKNLVQFEEEIFGRGGLNEWHLPYMIRKGEVFLLKSENEILGLAELMKSWNNPSQVYLINFSIKKGERKKGYGKFFLTKILDKLSKENIKSIELTVSPKNISALNLYKNNFGFKEIKFYKNEYGPEKDRILLELKLSKE